MTTLRSTLTAVPNSKLALFFRTNQSKQLLPVDKDGTVFFDYNPIYFNYVLDQLRTIKHMSKRSWYQYQFSPPFVSGQLNFTHMLSDLGLTRTWCALVVLLCSCHPVHTLADHLLSPAEGTHTNLSVSSLVGWQECYRSAYDKPFDLSAFASSCNGSRILVACRSTDNKNVLTLAGVGQREDVMHPCQPRPCRLSRRSKKRNRTSSCLTNHHCFTQAKRGVGWYHVSNQTWGFVRGSLSFVVNPCDASNLDSAYRLCWTLQADGKPMSGDRCGSAKNLQKSNKWERLVYYID